MKRYFAKRSEMTAYALASGLEIVRCKQSCNHVSGSYRPAILLLKAGRFVNARLIKCKVCARKGVAV